MYTFLKNDIGLLNVLNLVSIFTGKFIFASLVVTFRHGREEDEVMGVSFKKELVVDRVQVFPNNKEENPSKIQVNNLQTLFTFPNCKDL